MTEAISEKNAISQAFTCLFVDIKKLSVKSEFRASNERLADPGDRVLRRGSAGILWL